MFFLNRIARKKKDFKRNFRDSKKKRKKDKNLRNKQNKKSY